MYAIEKTKTGALQRLLERSGRVTIVSHTHPDGDAVGSSCALCTFLQEARKDVMVIFPTPVPPAVSFAAEGLPVSIFSLSEESCRERIASSDLLVCLDFNSFERTEAMADCLRACPAPKVLIDHHLNPSAADFDICFSETEISSASELLFWVLLSLDGVDSDAGKLPERTRQALMVGMTTDTNNFANSVFPSTFSMASMLLAAGVDRDDIISRLYNNYGENRVRLFGEMLKDELEISRSGVATMFLTSEIKEKYQIGEGDAEGLVNQPLAIGKVKMSILVKEENDGQVRVSVRSKRGVSANLLAREYFHGGGHEMAAGGKILVPEDAASKWKIAEYVRSSAEKFIERYEN